MAMKPKVKTEEARMSTAVQTHIWSEECAVDLVEFLTRYFAMAKDYHARAIHEYVDDTSYAVVVDNGAETYDLTLKEMRNDARAFVKGWEAHYWNHHNTTSKGDLNG